MSINIKNQGDIGKVNIKNIGDVGKIYAKTPTGANEIWSAETVVFDYGLISGYSFARKQSQYVAQFSVGTRIYMFAEQGGSWITAGSSNIDFTKFKTITFLFDNENAFGGFLALGVTKNNFNTNGALKSTKIYSSGTNKTVTLDISSVTGIGQIFLECNQLNQKLWVKKIYLEE